MTEPTNDGNRAIMAGFLAFLALGVLFLATFGLFRVLVPAILDAHFFGSVFAASAVALFGTFGLGVLAVFLFARIARMMRK